MSARSLPTARSARFGHLRVLSSAVAVGTFAAVVLVASTGSALAVTPANVQRVAGPDRLATAIATSQDQFPTAGSASAVVLARSDTFPDALAGGPLAAKVHGPLLLTSSAALDASVKIEITRVAVAGATVYILGGTSAISAGVETTLTGMGFVPKRLSGANRFATSVAIADEMGDPTTVFEATGLNFPDALSGGPAAIKTGGVILLTNGPAQSDATAAYLAAHPGGTHYALGGPAAAADPSATPLVGADRFWTSEGIAATFFPTATAVGAATGFNFPDALAAGSDLAAKGAPLLLVPSSGALPEAITVDLLGRLLGGAATQVVLFGGAASVSDDVATQLGTLGGLTTAGAAATALPANTGQFGVASQTLMAVGLAGAQTLVVDGSSGDVTIYRKGATTQSVPAGSPPRSQLDALPLTNPESLKTAVNSLFASYDSAAGLSGDPDFLFTVNADQLVMNPIASPSLRVALYAALAADDDGTEVASGVKDSQGRVGIKIFASLGADATDKSEISYIFDPVTLMPLEDTVLDSSGAVVTRQTVLSMTTVAALPPNPYGP